jgi:Domain of unknown function (DUF4198)
MRTSMIAAFLLTFLTIPGQAQTNEPNTASISGRVTLNGKPAKFVNVTLVPGPYGSPDTPGRQKAKTDDEGRYQFKSLAAGRYGLIAASYINTSADLLESATKPFKVCTIAASEELKDVDIVLLRGGVITGRITDADNQPVIAMRVKLSYFDAQNKKQAFPALVTNEEMYTGLLSTDVLPQRRRRSAGQDHRSQNRRRGSKYRHQIAATRKILQRHRPHCDA